MHQNFGILLIILLLINSPSTGLAQYPSPDCSYPCLPSPAGVSGYPPPPGEGYNNYPPPAAYLPNYPPPQYVVYPAPPPPDPITPWFPFYRRVGNSAGRKRVGYNYYCMGLLGLALWGVLLV